MGKGILRMLVIVLALLYNTLHAQQIEIGKATDNGFIITADTNVLKKAIQNTLHDGTIINELSIHSFGKFHYLIANGTYKQFNKTTGIKLVYDINTRTFFIKQQDGYITCTSAACNNCSLFKESGKIIGCKCAEKSTISNQCNYTNVEESSFYQNYIRAKQMRLKPTNTNR